MAATCCCCCRTYHASIDDDDDDMNTMRSTWMDAENNEPDVGSQTAAVVQLLRWNISGGQFGGVSLMQNLK